MLENIQEIINELHRMKKEYNAPQGCCVRTQERNGYRSKCLSIAIKALSEVQTLAQAKADGRLVVLPCNVGDTVYEPFVGKVYEKTVDKIIINRFTTPQIWIETKLPFAASRVERWDLALGKTVFLTREEAEKALEVKE